MLKVHEGAYRVALLAGGDSAEREISLLSGDAVAGALAAAGHAIERFDPLYVELAELPLGEFDVCFVALHGGAGEDGRVQRQLARLGIPFTGSDAEACRLAMAKSASKERFLAAGIPTPDYVLAHRLETKPTIIDRLLRLGLPLVVKPDGQGSSLGVSFVTDERDLPDALQRALGYDPFVLGERLIEGRELTVAVLDREPLPTVEIVTPRPFYDYEAKYAAVTTGYSRAELPQEVHNRVQQLAVAACDALGTRGVVRVDLRLDRDNRPWVLEVNTIPGMTDHSLVPKAAAWAGISMAQLCDRMVRSAVGLEVNA